MSITNLRSPDEVNALFYQQYSGSIFLGGGISNCPDWQNSFAKYFALFEDNKDGKKYLLVNPRRDGDLSKTGDEARTQIKWERGYLQACSHIIFWFPKESICPITLFELGQWATKERLLNGTTIVGVEPGYQREFDLRTQLELVAGVPQPLYRTVKDLARAAYNQVRKG